MRKLFLFVGFVFCTRITLAQVTAPTPPSHVVSSVPDSVAHRPKKPTSTDLKITKGTSMVPAKNIADNISGSAELNRFYDLILLAGLTETFKSRGPITIFVPDNPAIEKLRKSKLDSLVNPKGKYDLIAFVSYYAVPGLITARDIAKQIDSKTHIATFTTLSGRKITAKIDANRNIILMDEAGGQSTISKFDLPQSNGLIHVINTVLVPKIRNI